MYIVIISKEYENYTISYDSFARKNAEKLVKTGLYTQNF